MELEKVVTVPAVALAMGVSRVVLERAIKSKALPVYTLHNGGKTGSFRVIGTDALIEWLKGREGYHEALKNGSTKFHPWGARKNPETIAAKALAITATNKV